MQICPRDLGNKWQVLLVRQRALGPGKAWPHQKPLQPRIGKMGRLWMKGTEIPDEVAAQTLPAAENTTAGAMYGILGGVGWMPVLGAVLGAATGHLDIAMAGAVSAGGIGWLASVVLPRHLFQKLHDRPVLAEELDSLVSAVIIPGLSPNLNKAATRFLRRFGAESLLPDAPPLSELDRAYLALIRDVIRLEHLPQDAENELRGALRSLGAAIDRLPPEMPLSVTESGNLRGDAKSLLARAYYESDPVIAASLRRQAEALVRSAQAQEQTQVLNRRARILRQELMAQINALRSSLPALTNAMRGNHPTMATAGAEFGQFVGVAQTVRDIADEAASVAAAREELDAFTAAVGVSQTAAGTAPDDAASRRAAEAAARRAATDTADDAVLRAGRGRGGL